MKKLLYLTIALACLVAIIAFNSDATAQTLRRVKRHDIWGPSCRQKCADNKGEICGYVSQGCCTAGRCATSWGGQQCEEGYKLHIPGCSTQ